MNLAEPSDDPSADVYFAAFNQDCTSVSIGTKQGFQLYSLNNVDEPDLLHESRYDEVKIIERLFSSSLVAIVTISSPRKLKVCHFKKRHEICNYSYSNQILAVKLNRQRLVVCLEESLYIHNIRDMKVLHTIRDTPPNPKGLCVLSTEKENNFLAYPGSSSVGEVQIFDAFNLQAKSVISAHAGPLQALALDTTGTRLATASIKGTVIRIFNVLDGTKLYEFRRGVKRCVHIYSLNFSEDSAFLCASSNTETVHIFRLEEPKDDTPTEEPLSWLGYVGKALIQSASYLPATVSDMLYQGRSFATLHLPFSGKRNICAISKIDKTPYVFVICENEFHIYNFNREEGGICQRMISFCLDEFLSRGSSISSTKSIDSGHMSGDLPPSNTPPQQDSPNERRPFQPGSSSYAAIVRGGEAGTAQGV